MAKVLTSPSTVTLPTSIGATLSLMDGLLAEGLTVSNWVDLMPFIERLELVYQVIYIRGIMLKQKEFGTTPEAVAWVKRNAEKVQTHL